MFARLRCTVRSCGRPLLENDSGASCEAGHHFDRAREGYLSLLQPQDRRSRRPGDEAEVARARRRLAQAGHDDALVELLERLCSSWPRPPARILDIGCGEGSLLTRLVATTGAAGSGVDLSAPSIALAARAAPAFQWVVANADRGLPWLDAGFDLVLSVVARVPAAEIARVLAPGGDLILAVSGDDDLAELRELALGEARPQGRLDKALESLGTGPSSSGFEVVERHRAVQQLTVDAAGIEDLLRASYLAGRAGRRERLAGVDQLTVTIDREVVWCRQRSARSPTRRSTA